MRLPLHDCTGGVQQIAGKLRASQHAATRCVAASSRVGKPSHAYAAYMSMFDLICCTWLKTWLMQRHALLQGHIAHPLAAALPCSRDIQQHRTLSILAAAGFLTCMSASYRPRAPEAPGKLCLHEAFSFFCHVPGETAAYGPASTIQAPLTGAILLLFASRLALCLAVLKRSAQPLSGCSRAMATSGNMSTVGNHIVYNDVHLLHSIPDFSTLKGARVHGEFWLHHEIECQRQLSPLFKTSIQPRAP